MPSGDSPLSSNSGQDLESAVIDFRNQLKKMSIPAVWFDQDDVISIQTYMNGNVMTGQVQFQYRFITMNGSIDNYNVYIQPTTDRAGSNTQVKPGLGYLIGVRATYSGSGGRRGGLYVKIGMANLKVNKGSATLAQGYITNQAEVIFPNGAPEQSVSGKGCTQSITGTDPAANAEVSETVPTNARWSVKAITVTLVADANAANRTVTLIIDDGTNEIARFVARTAQTATQTIKYHFGKYNILPTDTTTDIYVYADLPKELMQGWRMRTSTANLQATDNYGAPQMHVEEWLEA